MSSETGGGLDLDLSLTSNEVPHRQKDSGDPRDLRYLEFVLESMKRVQTYAGGYYEALAVNQMAQDAIVWRLRVLADWANSHVGEEQKRRHPNIPWTEIYEFSGLTGQPWDHVNIHRIWVLARDHIEPMKRIIQAQLKKLR